MFIVCYIGKITQEQTPSQDELRLRFYHLLTEEIPSDAQLKKDGVFSTAWCPLSTQLLYLLDLDAFYDCLEWPPCRSPENHFLNSSFWKSFQRIKFMQVCHTLIV